MTEATETNGSGPDAGSLPADRLKQAAQSLLKAATDKAVGAALDQVEGLTGRLTEVAANGGSGLASAFGGGGGDSEGGGIGGALKNAASTLKDKVGNVIPGMKGEDDDSEDDGDGSGGGGGGGDGGARGKFKFMNIFEVQDVGVPLRVVYDQWTQFADFPSFMKKVETVDQESDEKINWKAQVFWSHRSWETTIVEQIPDTHIIWTSTGAKGHADGAVTFSEIAPNLTRIVLILEYYPQGFFEKTGNIWRAVGRRARLEFKHFCRHVMMDTLINREELEGWRGEIRDSEVVKTHEEAMEEEQEAAEDSDEGADDEYADDEYADDEDADDDELAAEDDEYDEYDEDVDDEPAAEDEDELVDEDEDEVVEEDEDEPVDEESDDDLEAEDEPEEEPERPRRRSRRREAAPA